MRWTIVAGTVILGAVVAAGGYARWARQNAVPTVEAIVGSISETVVATGRVVPVTEVAVANKIPGRLKRVLAEEGADVRAGQPIIEFDNQEYATQVQQAQARWATAQADVRLAQRSLDAARARWVEAKSGSRPQEIARARADLQQAQERWKNADVERKRLRRLLDDGLIARSQYDTAETEAEVARTRVRSAEETLSLVVAGPKAETVAAMWAQVQEAEAALRRAESQVIQAQTDVDYARAVLKTTVLESPVNGRVTRKLVEPGEAVDIGMPLVIVADVTRTRIRAEVDETDAGKLRVDQVANVTSDAFPGRTFHGRIVEIAQSVGKRKVRPEDPAKIQDMKVLEAKIDLGSDGADLKLGMTVDVKIVTAQKTGVIMIPRTAVPTGIKEATAQVLSSGRQERRRLIFGASDRQHVEVSQGVRLGDRIVVNSISQ